MESKMSLVLSPYEGCHYVSSLSYPWLKAKSLTPYGLDTHICAFNFDDVCRPQILNSIILPFISFQKSPIIPKLPVKIWQS